MYGQMNEPPGNVCGCVLSLCVSVSVSVAVSVSVCLCSVVDMLLLY